MTAQESVKNIPTVMIVLGATGDLAAKKIFPALFALYTQDLTPRLFSLIGFSRRDMSDEDFQKYVEEILKNTDHPQEKLGDFIKLISYHKAHFENNEDYKALAQKLGIVDEKWGACSNKLFYLAVPPKYYETIFTNLSQSKLTEPCGPDEGWTRVLVEKPFGKNFDTAQELDTMLGDLFKEEQIYRIDHYLGKDMIQNILVFRFSNNIFEQSWSNKYIRKIEIKLLEDHGIDDRGEFYDGVGALRDVGQNHLLQMLALVAMDSPPGFSADLIREKRLELIKSLQLMNERIVSDKTFRAQYLGYKDVKGVSPESNTETYFKLETELDHPKWRGVPITLEAGKGLGESKKEIVVHFKHPTPCLCPPNFSHDYHNKVIFSIDPAEEITLRLWTKEPGYLMNVQKRSFDMLYRPGEEKVVRTHEYEKLLLDCFSGDQTLFVSTDEVRAMWKFVDPIVDGWAKGVNELATYEKGVSHVRDSAQEKLLESQAKTMDKRIGIVGLGKMGANLARNLLDRGWTVYGYNRSPEIVKELVSEGIIGAENVAELVQKMPKPRVVWTMLPAGEPTDTLISELSSLLEEGDIVVEGGNSFYEDDKKHADLLTAKGIRYVDVGVSGGPKGARYGACLMVGGDKDLYDFMLPLYVDLSGPGGHSFFEGIGAGHFVKMVHNGIEYGMMQSIAEGFHIMKKSEYQLHLADIAQVYNNGSVIEGKLVSWMEDAFNIFGDDLKDVSGSAGSGGAAGMKASEGQWTVDVAQKIGIETPAIKSGVEARIKSQETPNYQGQIINALRNMFGGHSIIKDNG